MKRIVICADGTWNERDRHEPKTGTRRPTRVTKTARAVRSHDPSGVSQVVYYHPGVGTGGPLDQLTGGAFGHGMEHNIREMYRFIVYNHEPGDELYLFGFSRGACTVRSLAGFLHFVGLVSKSEDYYVPELYEAYANGLGAGAQNPKWKRLFIDKKSEKGSKGQEQWVSRVQDRRAQTPPIRFLGVWDTVGSLGAPGLLGKLAGSQRHAHHQVGLNPLVQNTAHALALDQDYLAHYTSRLTHPPPDSMTPIYRWLLGGAVQRPLGATPGAEETLHPSVLQRMQAVPGYGSDALRHWLSRQPSAG